MNDLTAIGERRTGFPRAVSVMEIDRAGKIARPCGRFIMINNRLPFQLLDCTLRDGGYYTHWGFDKPIVDEYVKATNELP